MRADGNGRPVVTDGPFPEAKEFLAGDGDRAITHYFAAAERTTSIPERDYLRMRAARLTTRAS